MIVTVHGVPVGRVVQDVTSLTLANNTVKTVDWVVPPGKRLVLTFLKLSNPDDVGRVVAVKWFKEAAKTNMLRRILSQDVPAGSSIQWPFIESADTIDQDPHGTKEYILVEGNTLELNWAAGGASAGGTDADGQIVIGLEIDI